VAEDFFGFGMNLFFAIAFLRKTSLVVPEEIENGDPDGVTGEQGRKL